MKKILLLSLFSMWSLFCKDYYVSPQGSNSNPGTIEKPFRTIRRASEFLQPGDRCIIRSGVYREIIRPKRSGEQGKEIVYISYSNEKVVISALEEISDWNKDYDGTYSASIDGALHNGNQIFADGKMLSEASWPSAGANPLFNPERAKIFETSGNSFVNHDIPGEADDWVGAKFWCKGGAGWICWTGEVTDFDSDTMKVSFTMPGYSGDFYSPQKGDLFVLKGVKAALDDPGEWFYDSDAKKLYLILPEGKDIEETFIELKKRSSVIDLNNRSFITVKGIEFIGGNITTDNKSSFITLDRLKGRYISHSFEEEDNWISGIQINGNNNLVINCDLGYSSGSVLMVNGHDNRIINNYLHHGDYSGLWVGTTDLKGRRQLFSHNTVEYSGRDTVTVTELMESLVQYNKISDSGYLTNDLGLIYANNTDFVNTVFQYNWLHDNKADKIAHGFHIDIANYNIIIKNNVIWNVPDCPISINHPSQNSIVYNNSTLNTGEIATFGWFDSTRQISSRYVNNIFNESMDVDVYKENNIISSDPPYIDPEAGDFRLEREIGQNIGAYPDNKLWTPGCDLNNPPYPLPEFTVANSPWMNKIVNPSFEFGTIEGWRKTGSKNAVLKEGNTWGNNWGSEDLHQTATNSYELELGNGKDGIEQTIKDLSPNTVYTLSAWLRSSSSEIEVTLGVKGFGARKIETSSKSTDWQRHVIEFKTGSKSSQATVFVSKSKGNGKAWCDNLLLPLTAQ